MEQAGGDGVLAHYAQGPGVPSLVQKEGWEEREKREKGWTLSRCLRGCQHSDLRLQPLVLRDSIFVLSYPEDLSGKWTVTLTHSDFIVTMVYWRRGSRLARKQ